MLEVDKLLIITMRKMWCDIAELSEDCRPYTIEKIAIDCMAIWGLLEMKGILSDKNINNIIKED